jgi:hypothetical protein
MMSDYGNGDYVKFISVLFDKNWRFIKGFAWGGRGLLLGCGNSAGLFIGKPKCMRYK